MLDLKVAVFVVLGSIAVNPIYGDIANTDGKNEFRSDYTYYPSVGYWFKVHSVPVDWHTARLLCHYEGAILASPLTDGIMAIIQNLVNTHDPKLKVYFSGVHQTFGEGVYTTVEGIPLEKLAIKNWSEGEPNGFNHQQCLTYSNDNTIWDYNCPESFPFICYRRYNDSDRLTECGTIDKAYKFNQNTGTGNCYKYHNSAETWERAQKICRVEGGHLAIINSVQEAKGLNDLVTNSPRPLYSLFDSTVAVGVREWGHTGSWWTVNGQTLQEAGFEEWCNGCPSSAGDDAERKQSCGGFSNKKLVEIRCDLPYAFVCEKSIHSLLLQKLR